MFYCITKKTIIIIIAVIIIFITMVGLVLGMTLGKNTSVMASSGRKLPVYCVDRPDKEVALTFDAAWGADKTLKILDIMKEHDAIGTFFLVGFWIDNYENEVKSIAERGFEIGNHSRNHLKMSTLTNGDIKKELSYVSDKVKRISGKSCKVFRSPFGDYDNKLIDEVNAAGMTTVQWDVDSLDWKGLSASEISSRVLGKVNSGSIVLFHNNSEHILDALPTILKELKGKGYKFKTVSDMLYKDNYHIDSNGKQIQNK